MKHPLRVTILSKKWFLASFVLVIFLASAFFLFKADKQETYAPAANGICLKANTECFDLEVADTDAKRMKGLSDRTDLPQNKGMIFMFDQPEEQCFWMKDMKFNIDIIWVDEQKSILKIKENLSPDTYPDSFCADNTKYVLEFNQGFAAKYGLKVGTKLQF